MKTLIVSLLAVLLTVGNGTVLAQDIEGSGMFSLQGQLNGATTGEAVADGSYQLMITVYDAGTGAVVATETDAVTTVDGVFSTMVGDNSSVTLEADAEYEIGISVDGGAELTPRIELGSAPSAITADVAANAAAVGGFQVATPGGPTANVLVTTNASGEIDASLLGSSLVTSVNGLRGDVNLNVTGSGVSLDTTGGALNLNITGGGSGEFSLPFTGSIGLNPGQSAMTLNVTGSGSGLTVNTAGSGDAALNVSNSAGTALDISGDGTAGAVLTLQNSGADASAELISALNASGESTFELLGTGQATINATGGAALTLTTDAAADAALSLQTTATATGAALIEAMNNSGSTVFSVAGNGQTRISSSVDNALEVSTSAAGGTALNVVGGLVLDGAAGTGTIGVGETSATINNALVNANSIILLTVNSATNLGSGLRIASQGGGSFTVSLLDTGIGALTGAVDFNYLIINQP